MRPGSASGIALNKYSFRIQANVKFAQNLPRKEKLFGRGGGGKLNSDLFYVQCWPHHEEEGGIA